MPIDIALTGLAMPLAELPGLAREAEERGLASLGTDRRSVVAASHVLSVNCDETVIGELRKLDGGKPLLLTLTFQPRLTRRDVRATFYASGPSMRALGTCADGTVAQMAPQ